MGKSADAPATPDYASLIPLQKQANLDVFNTMLGASRANQTTPYGSSTWTRTPGAMTSPGTVGTPGSAAGWAGYDDNGSSQWNPGSKGTPGSSPTYAPDQWSNSVTLSPEQQQLYQKGVGSQLQMADLLSGMAGQVGGATSQPLDFSGLQALGSPKDFSQEGADAAYRSSTRYLDPQQEIAMKSLESRLGEQGFVPGTPAYQQTMGEFQRNRDMAYADARDRATTQGFNVGNMEFQNSLSGRKQGIAELLTRRQTPLNEFSAMRTGTQVTNPSVSASFATPNLPNVDLLGAANQQYQNQLGGYNAGVSSDNALLGLAGTLGGSLIGAPWLGAALTGLSKAGGK